MIKTKFQIDGKSRLVSIRRKGEFVPGDFFATILSALNLPGYKRGMNILVDAREMDYSKADLSKIAEYKKDWSAIDGLIAGTKIAVVHRQDRNVKVSEESTRLFQLRGIQRRTFVDFDEAKAWATGEPDRQ